MKHFSFICILLIFISINSTCFASIGDKVGKIYSTDIRTYINNVPVKSYNIGGRTCVAIEEITIGYTYNNTLRTLLINSLSPDNLIEYSYQNSNIKNNQTIGNIYLTDIKTYFYNKEIPSYNIGGKTCVAIEDLGLDNTFSNIGGKFIWNPDKRTLNLEFLYENQQDLIDMQNQYKYGIKIENGNTTFVPDIFSPTWVITDFSGMYNSLSNRKDAIIPIYYENNFQKTIIGYNYCSESKNFIYSENNAQIEEMVCIFNYFYKDKVEEILKNKGIASLERTQIIDQHLERWMANVINRYDTEDYSFLYLRQSTNHGNNELLLYVRNDGTYEYIHKKVPQSNNYTRIFKNLNISNEDETVSFGVTGFEEEYIFDMKNCEISSK